MSEQYHEGYADGYADAGGDFRALISAKLKYVGRTEGQAFLRALLKDIYDANAAMSRRNRP